MLLTFPSTPGAPNRWLRAASIICRTTVGLLVHAITQPGRPAAINRTTGKVAAR